jgi:hypothetical protein
MSPARNSPSLFPPNLKRAPMRPLHASAYLAPIITLLAGCGAQNTAPSVQPPGKERSAGSKALEAGAMIMQDKTPIDQIHMYLYGLHFYNGDMTRQVEAHHYCIQSNEDFSQCVIFSGNGKDAKLIGIEYIISAKLFATLPEDERRLWHSHDYEVKSGLLTTPGLPDAAEHALMEKFVTTYGKTFHTWQVDRGDELPLGPPQVMMGFTKDGQVKPELVQDRDRRFHISTDEKKKQRSDIPQPKLIPGANAWQEGKVLQLELKVSAETKGAPPESPAGARRESGR